MAHFYGTLRGQARTEATRRGSANSGLETYCASWAGAIRCLAYVAEDGTDHVLVEKVPWHGQGENRILYDGPMGRVNPCDHPNHENPGLITSCPECEKRRAVA